VAGLGELIIRCGGWAGRFRFYVTKKTSNKKIRHKAPEKVQFTNGRAS
jgi:hypothetical protein